VSSRLRLRLAIGAIANLLFWSADSQAVDSLKVVAMANGKATLSGGESIGVRSGLSGRICRIEVVHEKAVQICFAHFTVVAVQGGSSTAAIVDGDASRVSPGDQAHFDQSLSPPKPPPPPPPTTPAKPDPDRLLAEATRLLNGGAYRQAQGLFERLARENPASRVSQAAEDGIRSCQAGALRRACEASTDELARRASDFVARGADELAANRASPALELAARALELDSCNPAARDLVDAAQKRLEPPEEWTDSSTGLEYRRIGAGSFTMGCAAMGTGCATDESPEHRVSITRAFYLAFKEVTRAQYARCVAATACSPPTNPRWRDASAALLPVAHVDWNQARSLCLWAGGRLPTEAEWERAARLGEPGPPALRARANFGADRCCQGAEEGADRWTEAAPVASLAANAIGIFDLFGNVSEWTADRYAPYSASETTDPRGPDTGDLRVTRGGSWIHPAERLRTSDRQPLDPRLHLGTVGIRCVRDNVPGPD
jgi:formylglycine-generating enzyme required for sulfatase activity